ncbi:ribosomal protein L7/L12 [Microbacterium sp. C5A9]|uniref:ribosomal protein L7/L12 n=1 Tax=Microbacterium sp. C5A9 TaxID=2736663 RepID=UPI001F5220FF|nr:ribosomal protein L7/L12 [Microbacterium sp. C5A9]
MELILWVGIVLVVIAVGAVIVAAALRGMSPKVPEAQAYRPSPARQTAAAATTTITPASGLTPEVIAEIDRLVTADQKIRAIKVYREHTGVRLQDAKDRIDHWSVSTTAPHTAAVSHASEAHSSITATASSVRGALPASVAAEVDRLVATDQKIHAIKLVREHAGVGLKEAKDLVESWPHPHRL